MKPIALRQQVKRNLKRFPPDFMFQLNEEEVSLLVSHSVIPSRKHLGGFLPYVFTEQGVAMLSSVLRSDRAIEINILIIRAFVKLRELLASNRDLARKLEEMEQKYDTQFQSVFEAIRQLMALPDENRRPIGFIEQKEKE